MTFEQNSRTLSARVVVADFITDALEPERTTLDGVAEVAALGARREDDLRGRIEDADAIMLYHDIAIRRATLERLERCKLIVRCGVGIDNVDHAFARSRGIAVANIPDYGTEEVADSTIAMMLDMTRGISFHNQRLRAGAGAWSYQQVVPLQRLRGQWLGIIGLGRIGTATALRAKAIGMRVLYYDPYKPDGYDKALGVDRAGSVEEVFERSFVLSLHCPLTDETRHIVNGRTLELMPPGGYLINTARGLLVDTTIIPDAIARGQLAGAALDVLPVEPPGDDDPLIRAWRDPAHPAHDRVIINPHAAFYCEQGLLEMRLKGAEACRRAILGLPVANVVN